MKRVWMAGVALGVALPLAAQQPLQPRRDTMRARMAPPAEALPHQGMMGVMHPAMMRPMAFQPEHLLERKDVLGLTAQQQQRLTALRDAAKSAHDQAAAEAHRHLEALGQTLGAASPDTGAARQHFQAAHQAMGSAHWAMLHAATQARAVLTDVQRARVEGWADAMHMMPMMRMMQRPDDEHGGHRPPEGF